ncbi:MAG: hypothetical protein H0V83_06555 [Rubrobacter sp.]|nr:hypothetical protein [Rubrobacter sp.]
MGGDLRGTNGDPAAGGYPLPQALGRHAFGGDARGGFTPDELRSVCRAAGEGLGKEDAGRGVFRAASEMVAMWRGLDLPAWEAPYVLRDARLGYLNGYEAALVSGELPEEDVASAAEARWGEDWGRRLEAARGRAGS